jgi:hypothetical protein
MSITQVLTSDTFEIQRQKINAIGSGIGDVSTLTTTSKNIIDAINELRTNIGVIAGLSLSLSGGGTLPALDGSRLTNLSAANIVGVLPVLNGSNLTNLSADSIIAGGILPLLDGSNLIGLNAANITLGGTLPLLDGSNLINLSADSITGILPISSGGTGTNSSTGSGNLVLSDSPIFQPSTSSTWGISISAPNNYSGDAISVNTGSSSTGNLLKLIANNSTVFNVDATGTVTNGDWNGSVIDIAYGGTGATTASNAFNALSPITALGDLIYGSGTNTAANLAGNTTTTKKFLVQTGTGSASAVPTWATISPSDLPTSSSLTIGTGLTGNGNTTYNGSTAVTISINGDVVTLSGLQTLTNKTLTTPYIGSAGMYFSSSTGGNINVVASSTNLTPTLTLPAITGTLATTTGSTFGSGSIWNGNAIGTGYGGTGLTTFTSNGAVYATSTSALTTGTLPISSGGTGLTGTPSNGQILIGNGTGYTLATITAGTNVSIDNSVAGAITITSTASGATLSNTSSNSAYYPTFSSSITGTFNTAYVSSSLNFNPYTNSGTGAVPTLSSPIVNATNGIYINNNTINNTYTVTVGSNAMSVGPITVASNKNVTVSPGSRWVIL